MRIHTDVEMRAHNGLEQWNALRVDWTDDATLDYGLLLF
jgi:hypothetical protein